MIANVLYLPRWACFMRREVSRMRKLKALLLALCFVLAILVFNISGVNFGHGPGFVYEQSYNEYASDD